MCNDLFNIKQSFIIIRCQRKGCTFQALILFCQIKFVKLDTQVCSNLILESDQHAVFSQGYRISDLTLIFPACFNSI